jgi:hypothetical protein
MDYDAFVKVLPFLSHFGYIQVEIFIKVFSPKKLCLDITIRALKAQDFTPISKALKGCKKSHN